MQKHKPLAIRDKTIFDGFFVKALLKPFFTVLFKLTGWKTSNNMPMQAGITIAVPHTSNWDFFYAFGAAVISDIKIYFSIKDNWCYIPVIGRVVMWLGAIPIDRSSGASGQVEKINQFIQRHQNKRIYFLFTPEGKRCNTYKWKTGFYHVAQACNLPIFLGKVDFRTKESLVFHTFHLTGNKEQDIAAIQSSYKSVRGLYPECQYPPYEGPMPEFSANEAKVMKALYNLKGRATQAEIAAKAKFDALTTEMLDFLVEKGIVEKMHKIINGKQVATYHLTVAGNGFLLHLQPTL